MFKVYNALNEISKVSKDLFESKNKKSFYFALGLAVASDKIKKEINDESIFLYETVKFLALAVFSIFLAVVRIFSPYQFLGDVALIILAPSLFLVFVYFLRSVYILLS